MSDTRTAGRPILELQGIGKSFGPIVALHPIDLDIVPGEIHTLLGENGAGKSTLVKLVRGQFKPSAGKILFDGKELGNYSPAAARARGIAMVQQELSVFDNLTVLENLFPDNRLAGPLGRLSRKRMLKRAAEVCALFDFNVPPDTLLGELTPGHKQIVEILRCISSDPRILILDEPTSGLNSREGERLVELLKRLREKGTTILYISHRIPEVLELSDRITILRDGRKQATIRNEGLTEHDLVSKMVGREFEGLHRKPDYADFSAAPTAFEASGLVGYEQVADVSLRVHEGESLGVFGLEGSGTVELSEMLYGIQPKHGGTLTVRGTTLSRWTPASLGNRRVAYLPGNRKESGVFLAMDVSENVAAPRLAPLSSAGLLNRSRLRKVVAQSIAAFAVKARPVHQAVRTLSGGNQQKLMMSLAFSRAPSCLIVNEPSRGVDVKAKAEIHRVLKDLARQGGALIVFTSELPEMIALTQRIVVMRDGRIVGQVVGDAISEESVMLLAAGGLANAA